MFRYSIMTNVNIQVQEKANSFALNSSLKTVLLFKYCPTNRLGYRLITLLMFTMMIFVKISEIKKLLFDLWTNKGTHHLLGLAEIKLKFVSDKELKQTEHFRWPTTNKCGHLDIRYKKWISFALNSSLKTVLQLKFCPTNR